MHGTVDYGLARRAVIRGYRCGRISRAEICDAHPDLLRAANYCGEASSGPCPICSDGDLRLVSYAFSEEFPKRDRQNGRVWDRDDIGSLTQMRAARLFTVEVCVDCSWNHLRSQTAFGGAAEEQGREAST